MPGRIAEVAAVSALAVIVTAAIAGPVLRAPSERLFGMAIVGRHHDPFTVMAQFGRPLTLGVFSQPVTDAAGALLARLSGSVAAYNWLVLLSFPLSAAAAYLLARHLALAPAGATVAAMAYAFSPFHLAHAAYHPHIAQTQWLPLYVLALWRCLDQASPPAVACLGVMTVAVTLSNFYGGLIAAVITPVAVVAYWCVISRAATRSPRHLRITAGSLVLIAMCGLAYTSYAANGVWVNRAGFAFPRDDLFRYSAKWWGYLVPPVAHPLLGAAARRVWHAVGVQEGLLEQQVSLGWGIVALGLVAVYPWLAACLRRVRHPGSPFWPRLFLAGRGVGYRPDGAPIGDWLPASLACVPVLVIVAMAALLCSLSPERTIGPLTFVRPAALLYHVVPMFRSYARFGVVVQLMAALLAGIGVDRLRRAGTTRARLAGVALVVLAAGEYAVSPSALWRDVLPTTAHRWVMQQSDRMRVLDCTPLDPESESVQWLTNYRITLPSGSIGDCRARNLSYTLAEAGYTHLLVRRDTADGRRFADQPTPDGLRVAARFEDALVFTVTAQRPAISTPVITGFFPPEHDAAWAWRWMGADAHWTISNSRAQPLIATLGLELSAFHRARRMALSLDGRQVQTLVVDTARRTYQAGALTLMPGQHELVFQALEKPTMASDVIDNGDRRRLSVALGSWHWTVQGEQP